MRIVYFQIAAHPVVACPVVHDLKQSHCNQFATVAGHLLSGPVSLPSELGVSVNLVKQGAIQAGGVASDLTSFTRRMAF